MFGCIVVCALLFVGCGDEEQDPAFQGIPPLPGQNPGADTIASDQPDVVDPTPYPAEPDGADPAPAPDSRARDARYAGPGPIVTSEGIKLKLITTRDNCPLYERPDDTSASASVALWSFFFVLPPDPGSPTRLADILEEKYGGFRTANHFYRVARAGSEEAEAGWLYAGDVVEWHHRQALLPTMRDRRRVPALWWDDRELALKAAEYGGSSTDGAIAKEPDEGKVDLLLPLLQRYPVTVGGDPQDLYRVAFIAAPIGRRAAVNPRPTPPPDVPQTRDDALKAATVDIVFVIDTTKSMENAIAQVRKSVAEAARTVARLPELEGRLRFGLVGYRDTMHKNRGIEYTARVFSTLEEGRDHEHFLLVLSKLSVSKSGSVDWPEDVLCGLATALDQDRMGWNASSYSLIVLVGDASAKNPQHPQKESRANVAWPLKIAGRPVEAESRTIGTLLAVAQPGMDTVRSARRAQIGFLTILVRNGAEKDNPIAREQYAALADGLSSSAMRGSTMEVQGGKDPADFSPTLAETLKTGLKSMRKVLVDPADLTVPPDATAATAPIGLIQLLRVLPDAGTGRGDAKFKFVRGYCTQLNSAAERQFDPYYLVRHKDLRDFLGLLKAFLNILDVGDRDVGRFVDNLQLISGGLAYDQDISKETRIKDILESSLGLPIQNDIFKVTPGMLLAMPQGEFDAWIRKVESVKDRLQVIVENPNKWDALEQDSGYGFVAVSDLP